MGGPHEADHDKLFLFGDGSNSPGTALNQRFPAVSAFSQSSAPATAFQAGKQSLA